MSKINSIKTLPMLVLKMYKANYLINFKAETSVFCAFWDYMVLLKRCYRHDALNNLFIYSSYLSPHASNNFQLLHRKLTVEFLGNNNLLFSIVFPSQKSTIENLRNPSLVKLELGFLYMKEYRPINS